MRRVIVAGLWVAERSVTYNATVSGMAGNDDWPCTLHQPVKWSQSARYALTVFAFFDCWMNSDALSAISARGPTSVCVGRLETTSSEAIGEGGWTPIHFDSQGHDNMSSVNWQLPIE